MIDFGAIVFRREGAYLVARFRSRDGRDGDPLASMQMAFVEEYPAAREAFMALVRESVAAVVSDRFGSESQWGNEQIRQET